MQIWFFFQPLPSQCCLEVSREGGAVELNEPFGRHDSAFHTREGGCAALASVRLVNMRYPFGYRLKFEAGSVQWDAIGWIVASSQDSACAFCLSFLLPLYKSW